MARPPDGAYNFIWLMVLVGVLILVVAQCVAGIFRKILNSRMKLTMTQKGWLYIAAVLSLFIVAILASLTGQYNAA
jgi:uncharacterized membrane protein YidH (DUF202 family)